MEETRREKLTWLTNEAKKLDKTRDYWDRLDALTWAAQKRWLVSKLTARDYARIALMQTHE
ncbi:MAG: hypothetical protein KGI38_12565 [Thaumarchaeota archaeon]|nr:hypothetical protein [Nitrososphaerota archaeon]